MAPVWRNDKQSSFCFIQLVSLFVYGFISLYIGSGANMDHAAMPINFTVQFDH